MQKVIALTICLFIQTFPQQTPLEKNNYQKLSSYAELTEFLFELDSLSFLLKVEIIGKSVEGRNLYSLKFSDSEFGKDPSKIRVLIFAQQHGNEQSGKEGALILARNLLKQENHYLLDKVDFALVPQINPDGSEKNVRRNSNQADLNRNHLILTEPETQALHKLFEEYLFEASMDVHEYYTYSDSWMNYGYIKNFDEQVGCNTNPNISERVRKFSNEVYLPFIEEYLTERNFSFHNYILGGPPDIELVRHSTYDINDGRQSLGILNSFSFIQEGKNGRDSLDNIKNRSEGQAEGMLGFLKFIYTNSDLIKNLVSVERDKLIKSSSGEKVAIQYDHFNDGEKLILSLLSIYSNNDTNVIVNDYRPIVKSIYDVERPVGYLVPKNLTEVIDWANKQNLEFNSFNKADSSRIEKYFVSKIDSIDFEGDTIVNPVVELKEDQNEINEEDYYFIPLKQLKSNLIVIALEPKSMLGLVTYKNYAYLLKQGEYYPILRVVDN